MARMRAGPVTWYLRSGGDHDTHRGELRANGTVTASCGVEFVPRPLVFGRGPGLPGYPPDPDQVCPACVATGSPERDAADRRNRPGRSPART